METVHGSLSSNESSDQPSGDCKAKAHSEVTRDLSCRPKEPEKECNRGEIVSTAGDVTDHKDGKTKKQAKLVQKALNDALAAVHIQLEEDEEDKGGVEMTNTEDCYSNTTVNNNQSAAADNKVCVCVRTSLVIISMLLDINS